MTARTLQQIADYFTAHHASLQARLDALVAAQPADAEDDGESYSTLADEIAGALGLVGDPDAEDEITEQLSAYVSCSSGASS